MHVVGARFADLESANAALGEIRASVSIPRADVAVRPLGSTRYEEPASDFLLAGRFPGHEVERVLGIVARHGGSLLSKHIEWPRPSLAGSGAAFSRESGDQRGKGSLRHGSPASTSRTKPAPHRGARKWLRRPAAPLRVRAARSRGLSS